MHVHPLLIADAVARRAQRFISVALMPAWNSRLRRKVGSAPGQFETLLADSIARGLQYFERLPGLELTSLIALWPSLQDGGEEHLRFLVPALQYYRSRFNNPDLRLFDDAYDPVAREVEGLRRIPPNHPINVLMERCLYADRMGLDAEAIAHLEEAVAAGGATPMLHNNLGALYLRAGAHGKALEHFRELARLRPDDAQVHYTTGVLLARVGDRERAMQHLSRAARLAPHDPRASQALAMLRGGEDRPLRSP